MKKYIIVTADENDGDYITNKSEITDTELELIKPVIKQLQLRKAKLNEDRNKNWNEYRHNWETGELINEKSPEKLYVETGLLTQEQVNIFDKYVPDNEFGIHTIDSVEILEVVNEIKLL